MRSKEVLKLLGVTRVSLMNYVKSGKIKGTLMKNGFYDYDEDSIYKFLGKKKHKKNVIYARVSAYKQKKDLAKQIKYVKNFCSDNNIDIFNIYSEIESGISLDRKQFQSLLDEVISGKIANIYISYKDRISRLSFAVLRQLFKKFGTTIIVVSEVLHKKGTKTDDVELFEDLLSMMHYFSTKSYSKRKKLY